MSGSDFEKLSELELDDLLREWRIPEAPARMRLTRRRRVGPWIGAAAAVILAVALLIARRTSPSQQPDNRPFIPIPYTVPLSKYENASIVRMNVSAAELLAVGYKIPAAQPSAVVTAEVLVGEDGRPHGIRLPDSVR